MKRRTFFIILLLGVMLFNIVALCQAKGIAKGLALGTGTGGNLQLKADAAILMDYETGTVLFEKNADQRRPPASTTKILTAIIALERSKLDRIFTASSRASRVGGSTIWLVPGESHSLRDLLYGLLLSSGNDAAVTMAEGLAGSETNFAAWMNQKAHSLGALNSHFVNPDGLPAANHYSTPRDLAIITRYALHNPVFAAIVKTKQKELPWPGHEKDRVLINHNKLLWRYQYADGVKTGYTVKAGNCLVSTAMRDGHRLIVVVMHSKNTYQDSERLFEYGFGNYQIFAIVSPKSHLGMVKVKEGVRPKVPVLAKRPLTLLLPKNSVPQLQVNLQLPPLIAAPVKKLQPVGKLKVQLGEKLIEEVPLVAAAKVPRQSLWQHFWSWMRHWAISLMETIPAKVRHTA